FAAAAAANRVSFIVNASVMRNEVSVARTTDRISVKTEAERLEDGSEPSLGLPQQGSALGDQARQVLVKSADRLQGLDFLGHGASHRRVRAQATHALFPRDAKAQFKPTGASSSVFRGDKALPPQSVVFLGSQVQIGQAADRESCLSTVPWAL